MLELTGKRRLQLWLLVSSSLLLLLFAGIKTRGQEQLPRPPIQPNATVPDGKYVGSNACAECHADKAKSQEITPMGRALRLTKDSEVLKSHPNLDFSEGPYTYRIVTHDGKTVFSVSDGSRTISEPVRWAFGLGVAGQTYLFQHDGRYIEGRVSFYAERKGLDVTVGHPAETPRSLEDALGRWVGIDEARACFGCHTSRAVTGNHLNPDNAVPGVTCESCHGPGADHISAMRAGNVKETHIFNPGSLDTEDLSNFCGACHRTWAQVGMMGLRGVGNVRFQPYRLTNSKCYDTDDRRISCVACHDPHEDLVRNVSFYDSKCTACHSPKMPHAAAAGTAGAKTYPACPVAKKNCATCHMPKYDLPGGHYTFTDHDIRIVRTGDPYPN